MNHLFDYFAISAFAGAGFSLGCSLVIASIAVLFKKDPKDEKNEN